MKERLYILTMSLLAGMMFLTACSTDALPGDETGDGSGQVAVSGKDSCYINLRIVNDVRSATRATEVGTDAENAIYDGILLIFRGNAEATAELESAVVIDQLINNPGSLTDIDIIQRLPNGTHPYPTTDDGKKLYVMALLNTTATGFSVSNNMLCLRGTPRSGYKPSDVQNLVIDSVGSIDKHVGLYMASKPQDGHIALEVYDPSWTSNTTQYLYDSKEAISQSAAANKKLTINVERAAARVSVTNAAETLGSINLNGNSDNHPKVHAMTWTLDNYYTKSNAIGGGTGTVTPITFSSSDFSVYPQRSYSGDQLYIAEGSTDIIVEVQLKDGSFLLGDCFNFNGGNALYTSPEQLIAYFKTQWDSWKSNYSAISSKSADDVFKYPTVKMNDDGSVTIKLVNTSFTEDEKGTNGLNGLSEYLSMSTNTKGFRDGKMYYTYTVNPIERNNSYSLTFKESSISGIGRPTP